MSATKITEYEACEIGSAIAVRAFQHLTAPIEKELNGYGKQAYEQIIEGIGGEDTVKKLVAFNIGDYHCSVRITLTDGKGNETFVDYRHENAVLFKSERWTNPVLVNGTLHMQVDDAHSRLSALQTKRDTLSKTLQNQMTGKSAKTVLKAWPEAAEFINAKFGMSSDRELVAPLEALLARFLPALPAPQGA